MRVRAASRMSARRAVRSPHFVLVDRTAPTPGPRRIERRLIRTVFDSTLAAAHARRGAGVELWTMGMPEVGTVVAQARRAEDAGWDGLTFTDSQNLVGDPFVGIAVAAEHVERLRFATGVTN